MPAWPQTFETVDGGFAHVELEADRSTTQMLFQVFLTLPMDCQLIANPGDGLAVVAGKAWKDLT